MKKISSVLLAFLMLVSSLFCANAAFGEEWSSQNGKNTFQSAENLVIGTIYNRPATEITGNVFKLDLNQAAKYTLSLSSNSAAKVEIYQNDDKNIIDTVFVLGDKAQKKVTDKNFDFLKGTYYFKILSVGDYTFSVSNYVCNHYFDVVTTSPTYFSAGYHTYTCFLCGYSYKTKGDKKKITVNNSDNKAASGYQIKLSTNKKFTKKTTKTIKVKSSKSTVKKLKRKKKYYVKVRAYKTKNGKTVYSAWSKIKTVKTK